MMVATNMKRGVEMSLQVVVVAVIVLLIAALLIYFVAKTIKKADDGVSSCQQRGAAYYCNNACNPGDQQYILGSCGRSSTQVCCVRGETALG